MILSCKIGLTYGYSFPVSARGVKHPWGVLHVVAYTGRLRPTGVPFFQVYKWVFIVLVEEYERVRKSVILVGKGPTGLRDAFHGRETVEKTC